MIICSAVYVGEWFHYFSDGILCSKRSALPFFSHGRSVNNFDGVENLISYFTE